MLVVGKKNKGKKPRCMVKDKSMAILKEDMLTMVKIVWEKIPDLHHLDEEAVFLGIGHTCICLKP